MGGADAETDWRLPLKRKVLNVIALDFDGTVVKSNHIKDQAFETIFSDWPEHRNTMMQWHLTRDSVDRREKFHFFVEEVLGQLGNEELIEELTARFSELTRKEIVNCPMVEGAQAFLDYCVCKVPMFLLSATPQNELNKILRKRCLNEYFKQAYGAPIDKVEILNKIMADENVSPGEMLYIGDSPEDQQAAELLGIHFIGRRSDRALNDATYNVYPDFMKIKGYFNQRYDI